MVIKPSEGTSGLSSVLFGSNDLHLFRKCPCPVWVIKPSKRKKHLRILAAVDPSPAEATNAELNALIMDLSTSLASVDQCELHIVHAWSLSNESLLRSGRIRIPKPDIDRMVKEARRTHKEWMNELLAQYDLHNIPSKAHLLKGEPSDIIANFARKTRVDLIVMGTIARTGIPGFFIGNTAEKTLSNGDCSVLAVKPRSFTTPVKT